MSRKRETPTPERTVSEELYNSWLSHKRKKDAEKIAEIAKKANEKAGEKIYPTSKPTIEKAILYGHCKDDNLRDLITKFFEDRKKEEAKQASKLK